MGKRWDRGDYCDIIPDVFFGVDLTNCCYKHDMDYWKKPISRKEADLRLRRCITEKYKKAGKIKTAQIIPPILYFVLRIGGWIRW